MIQNIFKEFKKTLNVFLLIFLIILIFFYQLLGPWSNTFIKINWYLLTPLKGIRLALIGAVASVLFTVIYNSYEKEKNWKKLKNLTLGELNSVTARFLIDLINDFQCKPSYHMKDNQNGDFLAALDNKDKKSLLNILDGFQLWIECAKDENKLKLNNKENLEKFFNKQYNYNFNVIKTLIIPNLISYGEYNNLVEKLLIIQNYELEIQEAIKNKNISSSHLVVLLNYFQNVYKLNEPNVIDFDFVKDDDSGIFEYKKKNTFAKCYFRFLSFIFGFKKKKFDKLFDKQTDKIIKILEKYKNINESEYDYDNPENNANRLIDIETVNEELEIFENYTKVIRKNKHFLYIYIDFDQFYHFTYKFKRLIESVKSHLNLQINNPESSFGVIAKVNEQYYLQNIESQFEVEIICNNSFNLISSIKTYLCILKELKYLFSKGIKDYRGKLVKEIIENIGILR